MKRNKDGSIALLAVCILAADQASKFAVLKYLPAPYESEIHILPAMPKAWGTGSVKGIRARGDVTVDIDWDSCGPTKLVLTTGHAGSVSLRSTLFEKEFKGSVKTEGTAAARRFVAKRGGQYTFTRVAAACAAN